MGSYCSLNSLPISILHVLHSLTSLMFPPTLYTFPFMFTVWKMKIDFMSSPWFPQLSQLTNSFGNLVSFIWIILEEHSPVWQDRKIFVRIKEWKHSQESNNVGFQNPFLSCIAASMCFLCRPHPLFFLWVIHYFLLLPVLSRPSRRMLYIARLSSIPETGIHSFAGVIPQVNRTATSQTVNLEHAFCLVSHISPYAPTFAARIGF